MTAFRRDPFLGSYNDDELRTAAEFLSDWLPFLSRNLCDCCTQKLADRIQSLDAGSIEKRSDYDDSTVVHECEIRNNEVEAFTSSTPPATPEVKMSWADMALDDDTVEEQDTGSLNCKGTSRGTDGIKIKPKTALSWDQRESIRFNRVTRKKDFIALERVNGKLVNILDGLELHRGIFSSAEQTRIVNFVEKLQEMGKKQQMRERTFSAPRKWMKGKGRVTLQFGCCYNYAVDKKGNPPGILKDEIVDPLPHPFKVMIRRLIRWHVLPPSCVPELHCEYLRRRLYTTTYRQS